MPDAVFVGETADAMVFDKPAGLLSVPGKTGDDLPTRLTRVTGIEPFIVHRLDMDTSGLILYAKNEEAQRELSQHFAQGRAKKTYRALLLGDVRQQRPEAGVIKLPLALNPLDRPRQCSLPSGRPAETHYRIERVREHPQFGTLSEVVFRPVTGRTHQLRLHAALGLGAPILGDPLYAPWRAAPAKLMCLHAETLLVPDEERPGNGLSRADRLEHRALRKRFRRRQKIEGRAERFRSRPSCMDSREATVTAP